jgi:hypothetical protein
MQLWQPRGVVRGFPFSEGSVAQVACLAWRTLDISGFPLGTITGSGCSGNTSSAFWPPGSANSRCGSIAGEATGLRRTAAEISILSAPTARCGHSLYCTVPSRTMVAWSSAPVSSSSSMHGNPHRELDAGSISRDRLYWSDVAVCSNAGNGNARTVRHVDIVRSINGDPCWRS